ncbi:hypothetical protein OOZ63_11870 [Paucibacter sp. PLA-PC-4]|uniref:hypothetical protein n=1 Tax=Paucibacter sp. PLA-PC-4 TaxID=2993655 RepID=UPI002248EA32|nr:hypothetical protein [Paucibacter sp. PLA-PC-4]MCX2862538.1 hypothetical protein [Paucibacter sp. PLA-PC-4]
MDAIAQTVEQAEQDDRFHQIADRRWDEVLATGKTVAWDEARAYLTAKARGQPARKPTARKLGR